MATTSPNNLWSPDPGNSYNLTIDLAAMQASVQAALNTKAGSFTDTAWTTVALASGFGGAVAYRIFGPVVMLRGFISKSSGVLASGDMPLAAALPAAARPANTAGFWQVGTPNSTLPVVSTVQADGILRLYPSGTTNTSLYANFVWGA